MKDNHLQTLYSEWSLLEFVVCTLVICYILYIRYCKYSKMLNQNFIAECIQKVIP